MERIIALRSFQLRSWYSWNEISGITVSWRVYNDSRCKPLDHLVLECCRYSISFHVLKCFGHIFFNGWNCGSDDNVVFILEEEPENVDEGIDEVGDLGIGPQLGPAPTPFVVWRTSCIHQLGGEMIPGNHLQRSTILILGSQLAHLKSTDPTGGEQVNSIFVEGLKLTKTKKTIVVCVENGESVVQGRMTYCIHLRLKQESMVGC